MPTQHSLEGCRPSARGLIRPRVLPLRGSIGEVVVVRPNSGFGAPRPSSVLNGFTVSSATVALAWEVAAGKADGAFQAWPSISRGDAGKAWRVDMRSLLERQRFDKARGRLSWARDLLANRCSTVHRRPRLSMAVRGAHLVEPSPLASNLAVKPSRGEYTEVLRAPDLRSKSWCPRQDLKLRHAV